jgi:hypothetical protein
MLKAEAEPAIKAKQRNRKSKRIISKTFDKVVSNKE